MATNPADLGLREAARLVQARKLSPIELVDAALARIAADNPTLNAFITVTADSARAAAAKAARAAAARRASLGPLHGVPISLKDLILSRDAPTTAGSRVFGAGLPADHDAPVVRRLRRAGAIVVGKANLHEVALGVTTSNEHFGPARNPWDLALVPGGSSGGSAVAVAARMGQGSVGSDTRGSIRIPAACCGITGLKPSYGLVSTEDVLPLAPSLDHLGPMTRSAEDAALLLAAMVGRKSLAASLLRAVDRKPRSLTIAVAEYFLRDADPEIVAAVEAAATQLAKLGHRLVSVEIPELEDILEASRVIVLAEAVAFHDGYLKSNPAGYGPIVKSRLEGGYQLSALQYVKSEERRVALIAAYAQLFHSVDALLGAALPISPPPIGTLQVTFAGNTVSISEALCRYTAPQNLTGVPALVLPGGFTKAGLPIGLQLVAGLGRDDTVLGLGAQFQRATDWHLRCPKVS
jgi:aspartyl-tRNA(Asn)/glutamyl-tRNA(Gln) amidotransferase subunit A